MKAEILGSKVHLTAASGAQIVLDIHEDIFPFVRWCMDNEVALLMHQLVQEKEQQEQEKPS